MILCPVNLKMNRFLSVNDIKRLIISRDLESQIMAVEYILYNLKCPEFPECIVSFINADVIELLCEALSTTNIILLQLIFKCLWEFVENEIFFEQQHIVYAFDSILRSLQLLIKTDIDKVTLICGLELLCKLISRRLIHPSILNNLNEQIENLFLQLYAALKDILISYLSECSIGCDNVELIEVILTDIYFVFHFPMVNIIKDCSNLLVSRGYLQKLPLLEQQIDPEVNMTFLIDMATLIEHIYEKPSCPILKAIWFIFSVAYLCNGEKSQQSKHAMFKLISFVINSNINAVYTHHPAILYWAFSDHIVPHELQVKIILLWLEGDDEDCCSELNSLIKVNQASCLLIMEVMTFCEVKTSNKIDTILSLVLQKSDVIREQACVHAWSILPTLVTKYSSYPETSSFECLANLIKYCCAYTPENLEQSLLVRISCLLPRVFSSYVCVILYRKTPEVLFTCVETYVLTNILSLTCFLLRRGIATDDNRVSAAFLSHEAFLRAIEFLIKGDSENVINIIMKVLCLLLLSQKKLNQKHAKTIQLEGAKILQLLQGKGKLCVTVLKFLAIYLEISESASHCIVNILQPSVNQLRSFYLLIHMICAKAPGTIASYCWLCLRKLLEFSGRVGLKEHLALMPCTSSLILKSICNLQEHNEAIMFLSVWLKIIPHLTKRALSPSMAQSAIRELVPKLVKLTNCRELFDILNKAGWFSEDSGI